MRNLVLFFIFLILLFPVFVFSQGHLTDIRPLLKSLTNEQKLDLLAYIRHLGANVDDEIQHIYEQIPKTGQLKATRFIESAKQNNHQTRLASVTIDRDTLFFKNLAEGTSLLDSFVLTNTGSIPYFISNTQTTCDCLILNAPQHPIMPGESTTLRVEFDSGGKLGTSTAAIILHDNSTPNKRQILYLNGEVVARKKPRKYPWED